MTLARQRNNNLTEALAEARELYAAARPESAQIHLRARAVLPGGNTREVLFYTPFPTAMARLACGLVSRPRMTSIRRNLARRSGPSRTTELLGGDRRRSRAQEGSSFPFAQAQAQSALSALPEGSGRRCC